MSDFDLKNLIPIIGVLAFIVWGAVLIRERRAIISRDHAAPVGVRVGFWVAVLAAVTLGTISAMGFLDTEGLFGFVNPIRGDIGTFFAAIWRVAVLACGVYAFTASVRAGNH